jgi:hypothetical protein
MTILKKSILIILFLVVSLACVAHSQDLYKWMDEQGNIHFTTDYHSIPPEHRKQIPTSTGAEETQTTEQGQRGEEPLDSTQTSPNEPIEELTETPAAAPLSQNEETLEKAEKERGPIIEFEGFYWIADLTGEARVTEFDIGTDFDFEDDLGLDDENLTDLRLVWHTGPKSKLRLAYTQVAYEGDENIQHTILFDGTTFTAGTRVVSDFEVEYIRLGWAWQFVDIGDGVVKFGSLLEAKGFLVDVSLEAPGMIPPIEESETFFAALPTIGAALDINPHRFVNVYGEVSGLYAGKYGHFFDGEVGIKIIPIRYLSIVGGWRLFDFRAEDDPDFVDLELSGFFVGGTLRF